MADNVPILRKTEPLQRPNNPGTADLFFKALAAKQEQGQQQMQAQKILADTVLGMSSLMEKKRQADMENAQGKAMLELRNRIADMDAEKMRQQQQLQDFLLNATPKQVDVGGKAALVSPGRSGPRVNFAPQTVGMAGSNPNAILPPDQAAKLGVTYGTTRGQAASMNINPLSDKASQDVLAGSNALNQLSMFEKAMNDVGLSDDVIEANTSGIVKMAKSRADGTPEAFYASQVKNISNLVRDLGERGVLTDLDIERIQSALPGFRDTRGSAAKKLDTMRDLIEENQFNVRHGYRRENIKADTLKNWMARKRAAGVSDSYIVEMAKYKLAKKMLIDDRGN